MPFDLSVEKPGVNVCCSDSIYWIGARIISMLEWDSERMNNVLICCIYSLLEYKDNGIVDLRET